MEVEWDAEKAQANWRKHGVRFIDASTVLYDVSGLITFQAHPDEERFVMLGTDALGRLLVVVCTWRGTVARIISAPAGDCERVTSFSRTTLMDETDEVPEFDFESARPGPAIPTPGKTRITIRIDDEILDWFREQAEAARGGNYQTMINAALREYIANQREPLEATLRRVLREEMAQYRVDEESAGSAERDPA